MGGVTLMLDAMQSARHVILSAGKATQVLPLQPEAVPRGARI